MKQLEVRLLVLISILSLSGCATVTNIFTPPQTGLRSIDGLDRIEIPQPGILELRTDHGIGGYDAYVIPPADLSYARKSLRLTKDARTVFLSLLRDSAISYSNAAEMPVVEAPGACIIDVRLSVHGLRLTRGDRAEELARLTLVLELLDSESGEPLLRYARESHIDNPMGDETTDKKLQRGFDRAIAGMELAPALRATGYDIGLDPVPTGCIGRIGALSRKAVRQAH